MNIAFDEHQLSAITRATQSNLSIITGSAGTGKTTIIKEILDKLKGLPVSLCAFTGKAAARAREATKREAYTIHKTLEYQGMRFAAGSFAGRTVIIDEASMVASDLMYEIVKRKPARLILVGDAAQLPPVGQGQPFHDIINNKKEVVSNLINGYRNKESILKAANQIRDGIMPPIWDDSENEIWAIKNTGDAAQTQEEILKEVKNGNIDFQQDIILVPRNGELDEKKKYPPSTVKGLNQAIKEIVNPSTEKFAPGDRIINTENNADLDIWNGTTGTVEAIDIAGNVFMSVDESAEGETVKVPKAWVKNLDLAYALTVHKSQGSQYRKVYFVALFRDSHSLLERSLIYTAVTRAKEECYILGEVQALKIGIQKKADKKTVLQQLLKG